MSFIDSSATAYSWGNGDRTPSQPDNITTVLPNATEQVSSEFRFAKTQSRVEAEILTDTELTIPDGGTLSVELRWFAESGGTLVGSRVVNAYAPSGSTEVIPAGGVIGLVTPETDVEHFCKIAYTASFDASATSAEIQLHYTA